LNDKTRRQESRSLLISFSSLFLLPFSFFESESSACSILKVSTTGETSTFAFEVKKLSFISKKEKKSKKDKKRKDKKKRKEKEEKV